MAGLFVKKGDTVLVRSGKDRGVKGKVIVVLPKEDRVIVEGVNRIKKHTKVTEGVRGATAGGIVHQEAPVHASNVQVVCPNCDKASRLGTRQEQYVDEATGRTRTRPVRICKRCGADV
jgi:large subunit ribosomal protein L24